MFSLQSNPIDYLKYKNLNQGTSCGAFVSFEGIVRNDTVNENQVSSLFYQADEEACIKEGQLIIEEALRLFHLNYAVCIQRIAEVPAGQPAIWIGAWAAHRDEAFKGCRYIIEECKHRLLIWKKEIYQDGTSRWIQGKERPVIV